MSLNYGLFLGQDPMYDVLGSVLINTNSIGVPAYQWVRPSIIYGAGAPGAAMSYSIPHMDSVSYKIKNLEHILAIGESEYGETIGDDACLSNPEACNGRGPFLINGIKYFIDYMFFYIQNTGSDVVYSPVFSIVGDRPTVNGIEFCSPDYGYFIGVPQVPVNTVVTPEDNSNILLATPQYTNDLSVLGDTVFYRFTVIDGNHTPITMNPTISNLLSLTNHAIEDGQLAITTLDDQNEPPELVSGDFYPAVLFRYVSENAVTRPIEISMRYGVNVGGNPI